MTAASGNAWRFALRNPTLNRLARLLLVVFAYPLTPVRAGTVCNVAECGCASV